MPTPRHDGTIRYSRDERIALAQEALACLARVARIAEYLGDPFLADIPERVGGKSDPDPRTGREKVGRDPFYRFAAYLESLIQDGPIPDTVAGKAVRDSWLPGYGRDRESVTRYPVLDVSYGGIPVGEIVLDSVGDDWTESWGADRQFPGSTDIGYHGSLTAALAGLLDPDTLAALNRQLDADVAALPDDDDPTP